MFKLLFMMLFWGAVAIGATYGYASLTEDYEIKNRIEFIYQDITSHKDVIAQNVQDFFDDFKQKAQEAKQGMNPANVAGQINMQDILRNVRVPEKEK